MLRNILFTIMLLSQLCLPQAKAEVLEIENDGLRAYMVEENSLPIVTINLTFRNSGYAHDPSDKQGLASLVAALITEGAGEYDRRAFKEALENKGIELRATASADSFSLSLKTLKTHQNDAIKLLLLALTSPRFDTELLGITRKQMQLSLIKEQEKAEDIAYRVWMQTMFPSHPYSRHAYGTEKTLDTITSQDLKEFAAKQFNSNNLIISIVGNITPSKAKSLIGTLRAQLAAPNDGTNATLPEWHHPPQQQPAFVWHTPSVQNTIYFGLPWPGYADADFYPAYVLNFVFGGGGFESRLTKEVREKSGLTYGIGTDVLSFNTIAALMGQASTRKGQENKVVARIHEIATTIHTAGITEEELRLAKRYLTGSFALRLDTTDKIAAYLTFMQLRGLGTDFIERRNSLIEQVTMADIERVANTWLKPERLIFVTAGERLEPEGTKQ